MSDTLVHEITNLQRCHSIVMGMDAEGKFTTLKAKAPLAEMCHSCRAWWGNRYCIAQNTLSIGLFLLRFAIKVLLALYHLHHDLQQLRTRSHRRPAGPAQGLRGRVILCSAKRKHQQKQQGAPHWSIPFLLLCPFGCISFLLFLAIFSFGHLVFISLLSGALRTASEHLCPPTPSMWVLRNFFILSLYTI